MKISRVLHDNIVVKIKHSPAEYITKSGIFITGIEQDFFIAEIVLTGPGRWELNKQTEKEEFIPITLIPGDRVILERNFHHVYDVRRRDRVDHMLQVDRTIDDEYDYFLVKADDCYLKLNNPADADEIEVHGEMYSILTVKESVARV